MTAHASVALIQIDEELLFGRKLHQCLTIGSPAWYWGTVPGVLTHTHLRIYVWPRFPPKRNDWWWLTATCVSNSDPAVPNEWLIQYVTWPNSANGCGDELSRHRGPDLYCATIMNVGNLLGMRPRQAQTTERGCPRQLIFWTSNVYGDVIFDVHSWV